MRLTEIAASLLLSAAMMASCASSGPDSGTLRPAGLEAVHVSGELEERLQRNFNRLEDEMYRPDSIFHSQLAMSWPGDAQGRIVLGLVCDAKATGRDPKYLSGIIDGYSRFMNEEGYFGPVFDGTLNEQQLSGNGWVLRGLCEYYEWTGDAKVLDMITRIVDNLFMKGKGMFSSYPIDPADRRKNLGDAIGEIVYSDRDWILSSDIGCVFIGMEGLIHAYTILRRDDMREVIDELINRFLEIDPVGIRAQAHATLTACRGLIRYADATGRTELIQEAASRYDLYCRFGMTENYENYNWLDRYDTWSEPCAVVDAFMVASQLFTHTGKTRYLDDAEAVYFNGLCHAQRFNGGFGCDFGPGEARHSHDITVRTDEASWCCTMRGAEGLSSVAANTYLIEGNKVYLPTYRSSTADLSIGGQTLGIRQKTDYPFSGEVELEITSAPKHAVTLMFHIPARTSGHCLRVNGEETDVTVSDGFASVSLTLRQGDRLSWTFEPEIAITAAENPDNTSEDDNRVFYGVLMLASSAQEPIVLDGSESITRVSGDVFATKKGEQLIPLYHLMDPSVWRSEGYRRQILF